MEVEVPTDINDLLELFVDDVGAFPSFLERKHFAKKNAKAGVWKFFKVYSDKALWHMAYCTICQADVNYTLTMSTIMLTRHMRSKHHKEYDDMLEEMAVKKLEGNFIGSSSSQEEKD
jgi:hypothetical protein